MGEIIRFVRPERNPDLPKDCAKFERVFEKWRRLPENIAEEDVTFVLDHMDKCSTHGAESDEKNNLIHTISGKKRGAEKKTTPFKVLTPEELENVKTGCKLAEKNGRLTTVGEIPSDLRRDYLNTALPLPDRAIRNIRVSSDEFRESARAACDAVVDKVVEKYGTNIAVIYPWRAGLAFLPSFANKVPGATHIHIGLSRDEHTLEARKYLAMEQEKLKQAIREGKTIVVADPMLATGGSMQHTLKDLRTNGARGKTILASIVAAPEGVISTLRSKTDDEKIDGVITHVLDDHLNEFGFIQRGLGDFGDKFCEGLTMEFFEPYRKAFTDAEWEALKKKLPHLSPKIVVQRAVQRAKAKIGSLVDEFTKKAA